MVYKVFNINDNPTCKSWPFIFSHDKIKIQDAVNILNKMVFNNSFTFNGNRIVSTLNGTFEDNVEVYKLGHFPTPNPHNLRILPIRPEIREIFDESGYEIVDKINGYYLYKKNYNGSVVKVDLICLTNTINSSDLYDEVIRRASVIMSPRICANVLDIQRAFVSGSYGVINFGHDTYLIEIVTIPIIRERRDQSSY